VNALFAFGAVFAALCCAPSFDRGSSKATVVAALSAWVLVVTALSLAALVAQRGWP